MSRPSERLGEGQVETDLAIQVFDYGRQIAEAAVMKIRICLWQGPHTRRSVGSQKPGLFESDGHLHKSARLFARHNRIMIAVADAQIMEIVIGIKRPGMAHCTTRL